MRIVDLLKKGIPLNDSNKSKGTGFNWKPMPFFYLLFCCEKKVQIIVQINYEYKNMYVYHTNSEQIFL